jgi:hypothetical protein
MIEVKRHDRELPEVTAASRRADRLREIREHLARPIQAWQLSDRTSPRSEALRWHIFGPSEPSDFLAELRKRRETEEQHEQN